MDKISGWDRVGLLRVDVSQGYMYPKFYGLAYIRWDCQKGVCYPIPLNWIVWLFREMYLRLASTPRGIEEKSYNLGYERGKKATEDSYYYKYALKKLEESHKRPLDG